MKRQRRPASRRKPKGAEVLSDAELLAALIAEGEENPLPLAETLVGRWGDLSTLPGTSREMLRHEGVDERQATRLLAAAGQTQMASRRSRHQEELHLHRS
jgi:DNA repair protein RadC